MLETNLKTEPLSEKPLLQVLKGAKSDYLPFWFMRQAGRYLPEYRELRARKNGFMDMAFDPDAACEVTMQPIRRYGMDAAIIFSDILVIPHALGQKLDFVQGEGPKLDPIQSPAKLESLSTDKLAELLEPVYQALKNTRAALTRENFGKTALIGFAGAPWTVATYMIEGGSSRDFLAVKRFSYEHREAFERLMDLLVDSTADYLIGQVEAGAEALQIFDSWSGVLDFDGFNNYTIEPIRKIVSKVKHRCPQIPIIGFPKGAGAHYPVFVELTGVDAVGLDSLINPEWARDNLQTKTALQGNLDPIRLLSGGEYMERQARHIIETLRGGPFIFNLGHGIHKETPLEHVERLISVIREY